MMKKMIIHDRRPMKQSNKRRNIIFDLNGVLLVKTSVLDLMVSQKEIPTWHPVNFSQSASLLRALKQEGHRLFVLSNMSITQLQSIKQIPEISSLFSFFDDIIISDMTPYKKPDPRIFHFLFDVHNLLAQDCIFIDDMQENLHAAKQAEIGYTILCKNFDLGMVKQELIHLGILPREKQKEEHSSGHA